MLAVRTTRAKLIVYPGREDWTELFDLSVDPYETKNLVSDPAHRTLLEQMRVEFTRQQKATGFTMPENVGRPAAAP